MTLAWPAGVSDGLSIACSVCGEIPPFDWRCEHGAWEAVIPKPFRRGVVCLPCFASMAHEAGVGIADAVEEVQFIGHGYTLGLRPAFIVTHATGELHPALSPEEEDVTGREIGAE